MRFFKESNDSSPDLANIKAFNIIVGIGQQCVHCSRQLSKTNRLLEKLILIASKTLKVKNRVMDWKFIEKQ